MMLRVHQRVKRVTTLGPGVRYGLWVQGCSTGCPGCISPEAQSLTGGCELSVEALAAEILDTEGIEGITISGGEPFLQHQALARLISLVQTEKDLGVIVYTGYSYPQIALTELAGLCDAIIDGPYLAEQDDGRSLRGSSNQRLIHVTARYLDSLHIGTAARQVRLHRTQEGCTVLVGVPSRSHMDYVRYIREQITEEEDA